MQLGGNARLSIHHAMLSRSCGICESSLYTVAVLCI